MLPQQIPTASSRRSSRVVQGCVAAFMLPFLFGGAMSVVAGITQYRNHALPQALMLVAFGVLFAGVAIFIFFVAMWGLRTASAEVAARTANPDRPWLWNEQWASGVLRDGGAARAWFLWPFAIFWNIVSTPVVFLAPREIARGNYVVLIAMIFPIIGIALLIAATYASLRRAKFGVSTLTLDRVPLQPGATFRGELMARVREQPQSGFVVTLTSLRIERTGSSKSRTTTERPLWQETRTISAAEAAPSPDGMRVPITFVIPPDAQSTDERNQDDRVVWRLEVSAELPGVDYASRFELPVFDTAGGATSEKIATYRVAHRSEFASRDLPAGSQVTIEPLPSGGSEFRIGARRDVGSLLGTTIFLAIWLGAIVLMVRLHAPFVFPIFFALFAVILVLAIIDGFFGRSTARAERTELLLQRSWLGYTYSTRVVPAEVESIAIKPSGSPKKPLYDVAIHVRNRPTPHTLGCYLRDKEEAEIVAARMWNALGREE